MKNLKLYLTEGERSVIIAALVAYGFQEMATDILHRITDVADDGPEVMILNYPAIVRSLDINSERDVREAFLIPRSARPTDGGQA